MMRIALTAVIVSGAVSAAAVAADQFTETSIGAMFAPLDGLQAICPKSKIPTKDGAIVLGVLSASPAAKGQLGILDLVTYAGSRRVHSPKELIAAIRSAPIGKDLRLKGYRTTLSESGKTAHFAGRTFRVKPEALGDVLMAGVRKDADRVEGRTFYNDVEAPETATERTDSDAYFAVQNGKAGPLRLRMTYVGKHWLFIRRFVIKAAGHAFTIEPRSGLDVERKVLQGGVAEWYDSAPNDAARIIEAVSNDTSAVLRYEGKTNVLDREIGGNERSRLWRMMMVHRMLSE